MDNKGFTLIELIATIALLAVISVISFVSINGVIKESKVKDCENLKSSIKTAAKEYVSDNRYKIKDDGAVEKMNEITIVIEESSNKKYIVLTDDDLLVENKLISDAYDGSSKKVLVDPFTGNNIASGSVQIKIYLNDKYSAENIEIYSDNIDPSNIVNCDLKQW